MNDLIVQLASFIASEKRRDFIIFGSYAIVLHGIDLGRETHDLDVYVASETYDRLFDVFPEKTKMCGKDVVTFYAPVENIEIFKTCPGISYAEMFRRAEPKNGSFDFPVAHLDDLIIWKTAQGREKDLTDIQRIRAQIAV